MTFLVLFSLMALLLYLVIKCILTYIFENIFLYCVSKKENYKYPFICFIPPINKYYFGKITNRKTIAIIDIVVQSFLIIWWTCFVLSVLTHDYIPSLPNEILIVLMLMNFIINTYLTHIVLKKVANSKAILLTLLNIFTLGLSRPIVLFALRNKWSR